MFILNTPCVTSYVTSSVSAFEVAITDKINV